MSKIAELLSYLAVALCAVLTFEYTPWGAVPTYVSVGVVLSLNVWQDDDVYLLHSKQYVDYYTHTPIESRMSFRGWRAVEFCKSVMAWPLLVVQALLPRSQL